MTDHELTPEELLLVNTLVQAAISTSSVRPDVDRLLAIKYKLALQARRRGIADAIMKAAERVNR